MDTRTRYPLPPVVPEGSRRATLNVNALVGGQAGEAVRLPARFPAPRGCATQPA